MSFWRALQLLLLGLKLGEVLAWSWWAILSPTIIWVVVCLVAMIVHRYLVRTDLSYALTYYIDQIARK